MARGWRGPRPDGANRSPTASAARRSASAVARAYSPRVICGDECPRRVCAGDHDRLLAVETGGIGATVDVRRALTYWDALDGLDASQAVPVSPDDYLRFVAVHGGRWDDPAAVADLLVLLADTARAQRAYQAAGAGV